MCLNNKRLITRVYGIFGHELFTIPLNNTKIINMASLHAKGMLEKLEIL